MIRLAGQYNKGIWHVPMINYGALLHGLKSVPGVHMTVEPLPTAADLIVKVVSSILVLAC